MILFNTKTRRKDVFVPVDNIEKIVKMYSCGPTVYFTAHIGNLRAYIFVDVLRKSLEFCGFKLLDVMNTTDVGHLTDDGDLGEDKVEKAARREKVSPAEITRKYTDEFLRDCDLLNVRRPSILAPATNHIALMVEFVKGLEAKGFTYITSDGVYFDSSKFKDYASFSGVNIKGNIGGARIDLGEKRNCHDFALWKFCGERVIQKWDSPWGVGCPGWHIECSAIALHYLGDTFDIHTGGIDAIPIHHTNEIAQTECLTGKTMCNFWCHNEFMMVDGGKMGKSLGNAYTLSQLSERGFEPLVFRYFVLLASYRSILNFTFEGLEAAKNAYNNLVAGLLKHFKAVDSIVDCSGFLDDFKSAIEDDLNTPKAMAVLWQMLKEPASRSVFDTALVMDSVLSLDLASKVEKLCAGDDVPDSIENIARLRFEAKQRKDFATADILRNKIFQAGWDVLDSKDGYSLKKRN